MSSLPMYVLLTAAELALCFVYGAPVSAVLRRPLLTPFTPLAGLALMSGLQWWLLDRAGLVVGRTAWPITGIACAATALVLLRGCHRRPGAVTAGDAALLAYTALGTLCVYAAYYRDSMAEVMPVPVSLGNNDLPLYALLAQHVSSFDFTHSGAITGAHLGSAARLDVVGVFTLLATASRVTSLPIDDVLMPTLLLGVLLCCASLASLLRTVMGLPPALASLVALVACGGNMFYYGVGHGFVSQFFGMAAVFTSLSLIWSWSDKWGGDRRPLRGITPMVAQLAALQVVLLCFYPHMAFLGLLLSAGPPMLAAYIWTRPAAELARRCGAIVAATSTALIVAMLLVSTRATAAIERTATLKETAAGWVLHQVDLAQFLGLRAFPSDGYVSPPAAPFSDGQHLAVVPWATVLPALLGVIAVFVYLRRWIRRSATTLVVVAALALLAVALLSYGALYAYYGPSYQQWKWALLVQPVVPAALLVLAAKSLSVLGNVCRRSIVAALGASCAVVSLFALAAAMRSRSASHHLLRIEGAVHELSKRPDVRHEDAVNIRLEGPSAVWDTMWAAYFVPAESKTLLSPSYFPPSAPDADAPTLARRRGGEEIRLLPPAAHTGPSVVRMARIGE
ncbi:MAG TPA: hypothetical protein VNB24_05865 [Acidimicrobiales bacterium]|nr:hypothetical protein [Acidimicrobiales bacterium]